MFNIIQYLVNTAFQYRMTLFKNQGILSKNTGITFLGNNGTIVRLYHVIKIASRIAINIQINTTIFI